MNKIVIYTVIGSLTLLASNFSFAATAEVEWNEPEKYRDIRAGNETRKHFQNRVFKQLGDHFSKLAEQLPEGQTLKVKVTDVDLAGDVNFGGMNQVRIIKRVFSPRLEFSYQLLDKQNQEVTASDVDLKDLGFLDNHLKLRYRNRSFGYEKQMLDDWFSETFMTETIAKN
ncbi:DUF3016 domain-containing protein [Endozoicomonas sp. G2_1]|uniref:DUF3016 domain-containing protein n=1 Tax=Endozoicomonas sp. G2_1 TaxID=2821091 RepID=UPI001ADD16E4|nr:DUF3016 domain-containing protein [Endozoicomonas sp. G2_1]MBO9491032.1 DUF3016 domain-containing protein [Endozoicomonas sp. G2_1]